MRVGPPPARPCGGGEPFDHVGAVDERSQAVVQEQAVVRVLAAQAKDGRRDADVAEREAFLDQRDAEPLRSCGEERAGRDGGAVAVSVRLHHRADAGARGGAACLLQIVLHRLCVDARLSGTYAQIERPAGWLTCGYERDFSELSCCQGHGLRGMTLTTTRRAVGFPGAPG